MCTMLTSYHFLLPKCAWLNYRNIPFPVGPIVRTFRLTVNGRFKTCCDKLGTDGPWPDWRLLSVMKMNKLTSVILKHRLLITRSGYELLFEEGESLDFHIEPPLKPVNLNPVGLIISEMALESEWMGNFPVRYCWTLIEFLMHFSSSYRLA